MKRKTILKCRTALSHMSAFVPPDREVDALDVIYTKLMLGGKAIKRVGEGTARKQAREYAERQRKAALRNAVDAGVVFK